MSWYRASTISLTNGSTAVTGAATDFIANSAVGEGLLAPDGKVYEIAAIVSTTALTLGSAYLGSTASGQSYAIIPSQSYLRDLALQAATLVNDYQSVLDSAGAGKFGDGTLGSPGIQFSSDSNTGLRRTGTDAVALVTGGVDRITVDAAGAVAVVASLSVAGSAVPTIASTSTLTNKTLALGSNTISGTLAQFNTAVTDADLASLAGTETLTNKTLTNPSYSGATANGGTVTTIDINGGTIDGTVIGGTTPAAVSATTLSATHANGFGITSKTNDATAANNAGVLTYGVASATAATRRSILFLDPNGGDGSGGDYVALDVYGNGTFTIANEISGGVINLGIGGTGRASVSSTGLAVTGALSVAGAAGGRTFSTTGGAAKIKMAAADAAWATYYGSEAASSTLSLSQFGAFGVTKDTSDYSYVSAQGQDYSTATLKVTTTGLAVTGTLSATGNTTLGDAAGDTLNVANGSLLLDASGNLGLGVTPSAFPTTKTLEMPNGVMFSSWQGYSTYGILQNNYHDGVSWKYKVTNFASRFCANDGNVGGFQWYTAPSGTAGNTITFTQAMTLDASGNLLVGVTADTNVPTTGVTLRNSSGTTGNIGIGHASGIADGNPYINFAYNAGGIGSITQSGTTAVMYNTTSDARLKENITDANDAASLIDALQVRQFDWKADGSHQRYGFVAQELYEVAPEAVCKPQDPDEMMAVDYSKLVPMLVKELQSLRARVAQLEGI